MHAKLLQHGPGTHVPAATVMLLSNGAPRAAARTAAPHGRGAAEDTTALLPPASRQFHQAAYMLCWRPPGPQLSTSSSPLLADARVKGHHQASAAPVRPRLWCAGRLFLVPSPDGARPGVPCPALLPGN